MTVSDPRRVFPRARRRTSMESELTFVAPEGVYSVTEEHKPTQLNTHIINQFYPTLLSTVVVRYPLSKPAVTPGLAQLLGGGKDKDKDKDGKKEHGEKREKEDGQSLSSSDKPGTDDESGSPQASPALQPQSPPLAFESPKLFSSPSIGMGKKKSASRPKHNIRTTTSTFVTRLQSVENINRILQNKQGDVSYMFYNHAKNFFWTELGTKAKVRLTICSLCTFCVAHPRAFTGASCTHHLLGLSNLP